jgi:hypothetical protein
MPETPKKNRVLEINRMNFIEPVLVGSCESP